jgi:hypothetical protein
MIIIRKEEGDKDKRPFPLPQPALSRLFSLTLMGNGKKNKNNFALQGQFSIYVGEFEFKKILIS